MSITHYCSGHNSVCVCVCERERERERESTLSCCFSRTRTRSSNQRDTYIVGSFQPNLRQSKMEFDFHQLLLIGLFKQ